MASTDLSQFSAARSRTSPPGTPTRWRILVGIGGLALVGNVALVFEILSAPLQRRAAAAASAETHAGLDVSERPAAVGQDAALAAQPEQPAALVVPGALPPLKGVPRQDPGLAAAARMDPDALGADDPQRVQLILEVLVEVQAKLEALCLDLEHAPAGTDAQKAMNDGMQQVIALVEQRLGTLQDLQLSDKDEELVRRRATAALQDVTTRLTSAVMRVTAAQAASEEELSPMQVGARPDPSQDIDLDDDGRSSYPAQGPAVVAPTGRVDDSE